MQEKLLNSFLVRVSQRKNKLQIDLLNIKTQEKLELKDFSELAEFIERSSLSPPEVNDQYES